MYLKGILNTICGRSSIWLERIPVTDEVAGSSPVARASFLS